MDTGYRKTEYLLPGFRLTHTVGIDAGRSTLDYPHFNGEQMLLYMIHGSGNVMMGDKSYQIHAGDLILTAPAQLYHCTIAPNTYHERVVLHITPAFFRQFPCDITRLQAQQSRCISGRTDVAEKVGELLTLAVESGVNREILTVCKLTELLVHLQEITETTACAQALENRLIDRVLAYLNENFDRAISIDTVAGYFHITGSYLSHLFKDHTGLSLWNYVILRRLQLVNTLLRQGMSAEDACYRAGFDNYANFYRLYKKHLGMTPSRYKKQAQ